MVPLGGTLPKHSNLQNWQHAILKTIFPIYLIPSFIHHIPTEVLLHANPLLGTWDTRTNKGLLKLSKETAWCWIKVMEAEGKGGGWIWDIFKESKTEPPLSTYHSQAYSLSSANYSLHGSLQHENTGNAGPLVLKEGKAVPLFLTLSISLDCSILPEAQQGKWKASSQSFVWEETRSLLAWVCLTDTPMARAVCHRSRSVTQYHTLAQVPSESRGWLKLLGQDKGVSS